MMAHRAMATAAKHAPQTRSRASAGSSRSTKDVPARVMEAVRRTGAAVVPAVAVRREWKEDKPLTWNGAGNPRARAYERLLAVCGTDFLSLERFSSIGTRSW